MKLKITNHAKMGMNKYEISRKMVKDGMENPDSILEGHSGREIAQKRINRHVLRIIFEKEKNTCVIVTL